MGKLLWWKIMSKVHNSVSAINILALHDIFEFVFQWTLSTCTHDYIYTVPHSIQNSDSIALKSINRLHFVLSAILTLRQKSENKANLIITSTSTILSHYSLLTVISYMPCGVHSFEHFKKLYQSFQKCTVNELPKKKQNKEKEMCVLLWIWQCGLVHTKCVSFDGELYKFQYGFNIWNCFSTL